MTSAPLVPPVLGGVLVATPNSQVRDQVLKRLEQRRGPVHVASGGAEALAKLEKGDWQMLFLDRQLPDLDAEELVTIIEQRYPGIRLVMVDSCVDDCAEKLVWTNDLKEVHQARAKPSLIENNSAPLPGMIGDTEPIRHVYRMVRLVARRNTTVLITGPTGSGKELVARAIHQLSGRAGHSFSVLNCAAIPEGLIESELFGYARGAFTGAAQTYAGRILAAQGGTLFLDEIGELPLNAQSKLLRFLEQKEVQKLGSAETTKVDVRFVAATNRNLAEAVDDGAFREDLFFRLCAFPIKLAPLADRSADILKLAVHFLKRMAEGGSALRLDIKAEQILSAHSWPGNVRELQQVLERAAILAEAEQTIFAQHLVFSPVRKPAPASNAV